MGGWKGWKRRETRFVGWGWGLGEAEKEGREGEERRGEEEEGGEWEQLKFVDFFLFVSSQAKMLSRTRLSVRTYTHACVCVGVTVWCHRWGMGFGPY